MRKSGQAQGIEKHDSPKDSLAAYELQDSSLLSEEFNGLCSRSPLQMLDRISWSVTSVVTSCKSVGKQTKKSPQEVDRLHCYLSSLLKCR